MRTRRDTDNMDQDLLEHRIATLLLRLTGILVQIRAHESLSQRELERLLSRKGEDGVF